LKKGKNGAEGKGEDEIQSPIGGDPGRLAKVHEGVCRIERGEGGEEGGGAGTFRGDIRDQQAKRSHPTSGEKKSRKGGKYNWWGKPLNPKPWLTERNDATQGMLIF